MNEMDENLLNKVKDFYYLPEVRSSVKVEKGFLSENYKISSLDQDYFLKKYRFTDENRIKEIHQAKAYFNEGGIPVIMPLKTKDNSTYFKHGSSYFSLFPFVSGLQPERGTLSKEMIISLGRMLGKLHFLGKDSDLGTDDYFKAWDKREALRTADQIEEKLEKIQDKNEFDLLTQEVVAFKRKLIEQNTVTFDDLDLEANHLIHGDYLDQNVFFDEEGNVKYVFDFEKTSYEPRTQELFRSATYSFLNTDFNETSMENLRLYVESYLEIYPINQKELENGLLAHYLKSLHGFWVEKEHYLKGNTRVDLFLELNYKRITFMSQKLDSLI